MVMDKKIKTIILLAACVFMAVAIIFYFGNTANHRGEISNLNSNDNIAPTAVNSEKSISTGEVKEEEADYEIDLKYPIITMADTAKSDLINGKIKRLIDDQVGAFKSTVIIKFEDMGPSFLQCDYQFYLLNDNFISLKFAFDTYSSGAAHPMNYSVTFNYDIANDKEITFNELFQSSYDYLWLISQYCDLILKDKLKGAYFPEGVEPKKENFSNYVLTEDSMIFLFDPYQVGPYAAGPQEAELHYYELVDAVDENGVIPRILGQEAWENILNRN